MLGVRASHGIGTRTEEGEAEWAEEYLADSAPARPFGASLQGARTFTLDMELADTGDAMAS
jgi:hypothetical protein